MSLQLPRHHGAAPSWLGLLFWLGCLSSWTNRFVSSTVHNELPRGTVQVNMLPLAGCLHSGVDALQLVLLGLLSALLHAHTAHKWLVAQLFLWSTRIVLRSWPQEGVLGYPLGVSI